MFDYYSKIKDILESEFINEENLTEARPTKTFDVAQGMMKHPMFEKLVELQSMADGVALIMRTKDGQAYEILIRPLQYAKYFTPPKPKSKR